MAYYNLIFQGKIVEGASLNKVKKNIALLFKISAAKTESLFSGKPIVIKKNLDTDSAKKYLLILKKSGAIVQAVKVKSSVKQSSVKQRKAPPVESAAIASQSAKNTFEKKPKKTLIPDISHITLSDAQSGSLEKFATVVDEIELPNIDYLSMSAANVGSLEEFATQVKAVVLPDISELDILQLNDTPLSSQSSKKVQVKLPDISNLSMSVAQEGTLEGTQKKPKAVKIPDISHLTLVTLVTKATHKPVISGKAVFQLGD